jgi:hypothetical protein
VRTRTTIAIVAALAAALSVPGCTQNAASALVGTWTIDMSAMKDTEEYKNSSEEEKKMAEAMLSAMKVEITFTETEVQMNSEMMGQKQTEKKAYRVKSANGNNLVLSAKNESGVEEDVDVVVDGDTLHFKEGQTSFQMKRKK